jgi:hypothetical protein
MKLVSVWITRFCRLLLGAPGLAALLVAGVFASSLAWPAGEWRMEKDQDGIQIYSRQVEGWSIREFKGVTRIDARLSSVVAVINDIEASREMMQLPTDASIYDRESDTRYRWYSKVDMPWPMTDRDILNQREIVQGTGSGSVTITDTALKDVLPRKKGLIRLERSSQVWTLTPEAGGQITAEVRILSDPAGPIPVAFINAMSVDTPFGMLAKLKGIVKREKYAQAKLPFINEESKQ